MSALLGRSGPERTLPVERRRFEAGKIGRPWLTPDLHKRRRYHRQAARIQRFPAKRNFRRAATVRFAGESTSLNDRKRDVLPPGCREQNRYSAPPRRPGFTCSRIVSRRGEFVLPFTQHSDPVFIFGKPSLTRISLRAGSGLFQRAVKTGSEIFPAMGGNNIRAQYPKVRRRVRR